MGEEELRARAVLDEMQLRIAHGPYNALGLTEYASSEDVRAAFLQLTKQFHPARFGRMSTEVQKLSNEVFLGIKAAHDHLQRILGGNATRPGVGAASSSQGIPVMADGGAGTGKTPAPQLLRRTGQMPPLEQQRVTGTMRSAGTQPPATQPHSQPLARGTDRSGQQRPSTPVFGARPGGPPVTTPPHGMPRPATPPMNTPAHGMPRPVLPQQGPQRTTPAGGIPIQQRPTTPGGARPITPQPAGARPVTPQPGARPMTPPGRPQTPPTTPPRPSSDLNPPTARGVQPAAVFDERSALRECMMLLNDRDWSGARAALHNLAAKVPQSKSYRALLCYARGREAHVAGRPDEAHLEYQRALQLDPNLDLVSQAIAELGRRR